MLRIPETELNEIQERADNATHGPWKSYDTAMGDWVVELPDEDAVRHAVSVWQIFFGDMSENTGEDIRNADFVAAAREDVPRLVAALRDAYKEIDRQTNICHYIASMTTNPRMTMGVIREKAKESWLR